MKKIAFRHIYGIDMGTGTVKIYDRTSDTITKEMNMIATQEEDSVFAVGNRAFDLYEKNPDDLQITFPMKSGRIQDVLMMEAILHTLLKKISPFVGYMPVLYFSVPLDMTELERRAYSTIARKGRFRRSKIYFVEKPIADALALGLPIHRTKGTMIINIGAQSTEVSIIAEGKVLISRLIDMGGQEISTAIVTGVRRRNHLQISRRTAQRLKFSLPDLFYAGQEGYKVSGIDTRTGLPRDAVVSARTVAAAARQVLSSICQEIARLLDRIPPQIRAGVVEDGIYLTGGSTHIHGLESFLQQRLPYPIVSSQFHEFGTVQGLKQVISHAENRHWAFIPNKRTGISDR